MTRHGFPETHVFFRKLTSRLPVIVRVQVCWVYDGEGNAYVIGRTESDYTKVVGYELDVLK